MRNCVTWIAAFALVACLINRSLPLPKVGGIYEKYEHFAARRDQYNVLFIGSSRFYHQIVPERFDSRVAATNGALVRSFNFGADGMRPPESFYLLRKILALQPPRLRWVVIEMMEMKTVIRRTNARTLRLAYWHDWQHTRLAWQDIARATWAPSEKCALLVEHGMHFARQSTNLGRGVEWAEKYLSRKRESTKKKTIDLEGFDPLPHREMSADDLAEYEIAVLDLRRGFKPCHLDPLLRKALSELIAEIRAAAAEPIFVITPTLYAYENFAEAPEGATLFAFNSPTLYPELFEPAYRYDSAHLDGNGAFLFTDLLAAHLADALAARR